MKKKLTVVMPVFNQEKYLAETIESVLSQSFRDFEFLILDDGSTDNSAQIIKRYAEIDKRILAFFGKNYGRSIATNNLVEKATGEWCVFLDADDVMISNRLEKQLNYHSIYPELDASSCHCFYIDEKNKVYGQQRYPYLTSIEDCKRVLLDNRVVHCAFTGLMVSKSAYIKMGGLRHQYWPCEDLDFVNRLIEKGGLLVIIQEALMKYRIHPYSISAKDPFRMIQKSDYANQSISLRRAGLPEISFEDYLQKKPQESWWSKFKELKHYHSIQYHRKAGFAYHSKRYTNFLWNISIATLLNPSYIFATFQNRLKLNSLTKH